MLAGLKGVKKACQKLLEMGPEIVILKQGKDGSIIFTREDLNGIKVPGFKVKEIDPTGAGDCWAGAFIVGYLAGWDLQKTAKFANAVGALKVEYFGPMPDTSYDKAIELLNKQ